MLLAQPPQLTHQRAFRSPVDLPTRRKVPKLLPTRCSCSSQPVSIAREPRSCLVLKLREHTANALLSLSLAAVLVIQQPSPALGNTSTSVPPPSTASTSSTASQAASRTVVDVVSGQNTVLNEENTPDDRQGSDQQQKDDKKNNAVGDTSEVWLMSTVLGRVCCRFAVNDSGSFLKPNNVLSNQQDLIAAQCICSTALPTLLIVTKKHWYFVLHAHAS